MRLAIEPLGDGHDLDCFDCGNDALTSWLRRHARPATGQGTRTYVLLDVETARVVGYFALAPHLLQREEVPRKIGRGAPRPIPAILLAKLALDRSMHGNRLGSELLTRALRTVVDAARTAGGKVVVVDAIDEAAARFYARHDFQAVPGNPMRLLMKLSTVALALGLRWP